MDIELSNGAYEWIRERGSGLYLWQVDFGDYGLDRLATEDPGGIDFGAHYAYGGITIFIDVRIGLPSELSIEMRRWPFRGLRVTWDGLRWGARGGAAGSEG